MSVRAAFLAVCFGLPAGAQAETDALLARLEGAWHGSGWVREEPDAPARATKCRLTFTHRAEDRALTISGKCAGGGRTARVDGELVAEGDTRLAGSWKATGGLAASGMSGELAGDAVTFHWVATPEGSTVPARYSARWEIAGPSLRIAVFQSEKSRDQLSFLALSR